MSQRTYILSIPVGPGKHHRLGQTLASVAAQSQPVKIALCHAGEASEVSQIVAPYEGLIAFQRHGPDSGQSAAINEGWAALKGDVYGWLNADDVLAPDALAQADAVFEQQPEAGVVCGQSLIIDGRGDITGLHPVVRAPDEDLYRSNLVSQPSCFVRQVFLQQAGLLQEDLHYVMDWDLWVRLMAQGTRFAYTPEILSGVLWDRDTKTAHFTPARVKELRSVVARQGRPVMTAKSLASFALHHLAEYSAGAALMRPVNKLLRHGPKASASYWGAQSDRRRLSVSLFHYHPAPVEGLSLAFHSPGVRRVALADGDELCLEGREARLTAHLEPGRPYELVIAAEGEGVADLASIKFLQAGPTISAACDSVPLRQPVS